MQDFVLHNENFVDVSRGGAEDRSQKLLTNTKKVRGLRSFLWIKPNSSSSQTAFLCQVLTICNDDGAASVNFGFRPWILMLWFATKLKFLRKLDKVDWNGELSCWAPPQNTFPCFKTSLFYFTKDFQTVLSDDTSLAKMATTRTPAETSEDNFAWWMTVLLPLRPFFVSRSNNAAAARSRSASDDAL